jgi:hypothetical protein
MSCQFAHDDGAYVLGALSPAERREFELHLNDCPQCARSVRELAGLPGLLNRLDGEVLESSPPEEPVPETLLPSLVREARRTQRRHTFVIAAVATAASVAVAVGSHVVTGALDGVGTPAAQTRATATSSSPAGRAMVPLEDGPVRASLDLASVQWGTRIELTCTYSSSADGHYEQSWPAAYALVIHTRDGRVEQVATWRGLPGRTMRVTAATAAGLADIVSAEVRTADGEAVLGLKT